MVLLLEQHEVGTLGHRRHEEYNPYAVCQNCQVYTQCCTLNVATEPEKVVQ